MGLILAIGLTSLWPVAIGISIFYLWRYQDSIRIINPITYSLISGVASIIGITAIWSPSPGSVMYQVAAILLAPIIFANIQTNRRFWIVLNTLAGIQIIWVIAEFSLGVLRPSGISDNGSALGLYGLMALNPLTSIVIALSLSRTALFGLFLFALLRNRRIIYVMFALIFVVHVSIQLWIQPERLTVSSISNSVELRSDAINGSTLEISAGGSRQLKLFGYGYSGYTETTRLIQPHNIYVLSVWELGILAIPFWIFLAILLWRSRNPYLLIIAILAVNVDEWYTLTEGIFYLTAFHLLTYKLPYSLTLRRS